VPASAPPGAADANPSGDEVGLDPAVVAAIEEALAAGDPLRAREIADGLHYSELADLFGSLSRDDRARLVDALRPAFPAEIIPELEEELRDEVAERLGTDDLARAIANLDTDDALYLIDASPRASATRCCRRSRARSATSSRRASPSRSIRPAA
jgi:Mg/Co/Ni transporter MgtE